MRWHTAVPHTVWTAISVPAFGQTDAPVPFPQVRLPFRQCIRPADLLKVDPPPEGGKNRLVRVGGELVLERRPSARGYSTATDRFRITCLTRFTPCCCLHIHVYRESSRSFFWTRILEQSVSRYELIRHNRHPIDCPNFFAICTSFHLKVRSVHASWRIPRCVRFEPLRISLTSDARLYWEERIPGRHISILLLSEAC